MNEQDKALLDTYMWGFNDELDDRTEMWNPNPLLLRAYKLGRQMQLAWITKQLKKF